jgi:negative regulator of replication initiation
MGRNLKVEPIRDDPKKGGRVRVPERMVSYVAGAAKKTSDGRTNSMRRISHMEAETKKSRNKAKQHKLHHKKKQPKPQQQQQQQSNTNSISSYKLSESEQEEWSRSIRKGFVTLEGTGYRQGRRASPLACEHRQWCDSLETPQIVSLSTCHPYDCPPPCPIRFW